ncbi:hypothetical protein EYZ11_008343 [Aspergillus tanneri]|uniref:Asparaginase n=1 Tax=Aspergillus tanneri TaxID=1220188 RepID=A0A4V3UNR0_9EURO|nr:uncharacterized protein ATNIH1004_008504 [Aspergillus tanneri]KAA8644303.1 hypothetical protein ATNIH1004_008504 [Aspergillus tanneri]THC92184.1 hypothetical protein EYZ11_008343 [Aspergillus tanneri]
MMFKPTLIIHGGAGSLSRSTLPPSLYERYHVSLLAYLRSTRSLLDLGASALDAVVHAVSLLEDDELFNCARGSVFTSAGTIEMEASLMVTSIDPDSEPNIKTNADGISSSNGIHSAMHPGSIKKGVGVIGLKNVRHPIRLAHEALLRSGLGDHHDGGNMHAQLAAPYVEDLARQWGLEFMPDEYFWTKRRWEEHRRGLHKPLEVGLGGSTGVCDGDSECDVGLPPYVEEYMDYLPQGTVGCVCLDQSGHLAVATSTGGKTNKVPGRVGDTPTLGAGFWAENWTTSSDSLVGFGVENSSLDMSRTGGSIRTGREDIEDDWSSWMDCIPSLLKGCIPGYGSRSTSTTLPGWHNPHGKDALFTDEKIPLMDPPSCPPQMKGTTRRAVAVSGTGDGDAFLRVCAARTACAMARFSGLTLADAVSAVAGHGGELQRSAGPRWGSGEGQGGIIGIEVEVDHTSVEKERQGRGRVVFDFNCGGMWRAWIDEMNGEDVEKVMVFQEPYY